MRVDFVPARTVREFEWNDAPLKREAFHSNRSRRYLYSKRAQRFRRRRGRRQARKIMRAMREPKVKPVWSLAEFFRSSLTGAMDRQGLSADDHTAYYIVNLLTLFARSEVFYDGSDESRTLKPLALFLAEAMEAPTAEERNFALQRIGDISLFVAGFFGEGLARRQVDIDYYVKMGGSAYGSLSECVRGSLRGQVYTAVFAELAEKFQDFVDVLTEVRDEARGNDDVDILRLYDLWLKTGSRRAERMLRRLGIEPNQSLDAGSRH